MFLFLTTDDLSSAFENMKVSKRHIHVLLNCKNRSSQANGVVVVEEPVDKPHGSVAIVQDLYGNKFDVIQYRKQ